MSLLAAADAIVLRVGQQPAATQRVDDDVQRLAGVQLCGGEGGEAALQVAESLAPRARNDDEKSERTRSERIESSDAAIELRACSMVSARWVEAMAQL